MSGSASLSYLHLISFQTQMLTILILQEIVLSLSLLIMQRCLHKPFKQRMRSVGPGL